MKKFYAIGVRRDVDGKPHAMWLEFDETMDLTRFFGNFETAQMCERKSEAIARASEFNAWCASNYPTINKGVQTC